MSASTRLIRLLVLGRRDGIRAAFRRAVGLGWIDRGPDPAQEAGERGGGPAPAAAPPTPPEPAGPGAAPGDTASAPSTAEPPRDVTPPPGFEVVLHRAALAPGQITEVIVGGTAVAVANVNGRFHAVDNVCPHAGGPIGDGTLDGTTVTCPYHGWTFDVVDGRCHVDEDARLATFEVRVVDDAVCVRV